MLSRRLLLFIGLGVVVFVFNEWIIHEWVATKCTWPVAKTPNPTKVMLLSDTHLLGVNRGHWFDKLRREWQMRRSFQAAVRRNHPDLVVFLGDNFDEGHWAGEDIFKRYVATFDDMFSLPYNDIRRIVVIGNHDVGFHYAIHPLRIDWFHDAFNSSSAVSYFHFGGNHFVIINSMALEGDYCRLCHEAEKEIDKLKADFDCLMKRGKKKKGCRFQVLGDDAPEYSRPIILQHFPLYRESDEVCSPIEDGMPSPYREKANRERWDVLSQESTHRLLSALRPRVVFGGHSHYSCSRSWETPYNAHEHTLASFSWRNNPRPSYLLALIAPGEFVVNKCFVPSEYTVLGIYGVVTVFYLSYGGRAFISWFRRRREARRRSVSTHELLYPPVVDKARKLM